MHAIFQQNIRRALDEKDWTQEKLARELNVSNRAVAGWCLGETMPQANTLVLVAEKLGRDVAWFFTDHDQVAA
jgi:transcriptional regulator with XRE-family HTH domain